ncbi:hypothetical protein CLHOM_09850 [Clostridium homopropionicum DSM 5847]|uniref:Uncharacterized protein n=1 Tax=Clostridium homopropionicum DSM 5847 TaxID=1121318 RepID=A0A0L6ZD15_9CLOT|nr:hypothetical protein [Clostridium homopropionicum]KOA20842.1 hypothetical protein CLHOM_09850 [Clostridium homopropionicum DSM 5847]SFF87713.1 hypothetical protein SAMN04488501_10313 [Clostridium homopropionicum]
MKDSKNLLGLAAAIIAVVVVRYTIQKIGIENIPIKIQAGILVLSPILMFIAIYKFSIGSSISKHLIAGGIIFTVAVMVIALLMIIKERYSQYFDLVRIPMALLFIILLLSMLIVLVLGLVKHQNK